MFPTCAASLISRKVLSTREAAHLVFHRENYRCGCPNHQDVASRRFPALHRLRATKRSASSLASAAAAPPESSASSSQEPSPREFCVRDLMSASVYMGHCNKLRNSVIAPYLLGHRNSMHVIDLNNMVPLLSAALQAVSKMAEHDGTFCGWASATHKSLDRGDEGKEGRCFHH